MVRYRLAVRGPGLEGWGTRFSGTGGPGLVGQGTSSGKGDQVAGQRYRFNGTGGPGLGRIGDKKQHRGPGSGTRDQVGEKGTRNQVEEHEYMAVETCSIVFDI